MVGVLESAEFISSRSEHVSISDQHVEELAKQLCETFHSGGFTLSQWKQHDLHPSTMDSFALRWIFVIDTLNFNFWAREDENRKEQYYKVEWPKGTFHTGYWALCAAIQRALQGEEKFPLCDASFLASIDMQTMETIFRSSNGVECPMLKERQEALQELGKVLLAQFDGNVENIINQANKSAKCFLEIMTSNFSSYKDETEYEGRKVFLWKRVQILVADIWACFEGKSFGEFEDIDCITMFADYRVPQILNYFGVLQYDTYLMEKLKTDPFIERFSKVEIEIRGCSIWSVELYKLVRRKMMQLLADAKSNQENFLFNCIVIDFYLWDKAKEMKEKINNIPIHKTQTIFY